MRHPVSCQVDIGRACHTGRCSPLNQVLGREDAVRLDVHQGALQVGDLRLGPELPICLAHEVRKAVACDRCQRLDAAEGDRAHRADGVAVLRDRNEASRGGRWPGRTKVLKEDMGMGAARPARPWRAAGQAAGGARGQ